MFDNILEIYEHIRRLVVEITGMPQEEYRNLRQLAPAAYIFAKEYGWSAEEFDQLTLDQLIFHLEMIATDRRIKKIQPPRHEDPLPPHDVPPPSHDEKVVRDKRLEARDKWLYKECCNRVVYETILKRLNEKSWPKVRTIAGLKKAASKYAERHNLPQIPTRAKGRKRKKK